MKRIVTLCAAVGAGFMMTSFALAIEPQFASPEATQEAGQPVYMRGTMASAKLVIMKPAPTAAHRVTKRFICGYSITGTNSDRLVAP